MAPPAAYAALFALFIAAAMAACVPADPSAAGSINPVSYNSELSTFTLNGPNTNSNDTSLLTLVVQWNATNNRTFNWIGIGSPGQCNGDINSAATNSYGGWSVGSPLDNCTTTATASYVWPKTFYDTNCAAQFAIESDSTTETLTFLINVIYDDCYNIERNGATIQQCTSVSTQLPVRIVFPTTTTVSTALPIGVFSASSINITAALASQTLSLNNPALTPTATFTFVTLVGESFQLDAAAGINGPVNAIQISPVTNTIQGVTRHQVWSVSVPVNPGACNINGVYSTNFTIFYTAVSQGATLPPDQNPIPNNASAFVNFTILSADFCAQFSRPTISAVVYPYLLNTTTYFAASTVPPHRGFLTGDFIYLATHVTSDFLPVLTTTITKVYIATSDAPTWVPLNTSNPLLSYGTARGGVDSANSVAYPRPDAVSWFILDPSVFVVGGDRNVQYNFQIDILVTFNNNGQKRSAVVRQNAGSVSQSAQASTFALIAGGSVSSALAASANLFAVCAAVLAACLLL